jgi:hypothetical protein
MTSMVAGSRMGAAGFVPLGFREGEEPLDEVVDGLEAVVVPGEDFVEGAAGVVRGSVAIKGDQEA